MDRFTTEDLARVVRDNRVTKEPIVLYGFTTEEYAKELGVTTNYGQRKVRLRLAEMKRQGIVASAMIPRPNCHDIIQAVQGWVWVSPQERE